MQRSSGSSDEPTPQRSTHTPHAHHHPHHANTLSWAMCLCLVCVTCAQSAMRSLCRALLALSAVAICATAAQAQSCGISGLDFRSAAALCRHDVRCSVLCSHLLRVCSLHDIARSSLSKADMLGSDGGSQADYYVRFGTGARCVCKGRQVKRACAVYLCAFADDIRSYGVSLYLCHASVCGQVSQSGCASAGNNVSACYVEPNISPPSYTDIGSLPL